MHAAGPVTVATVLRARRRQDGRRL